jgi:hypothetical protein
MSACRVRIAFGLLLSNHASARVCPRRAISAAFVPSRPGCAQTPVRRGFARDSPGRSRCRRSPSRRVGFLTIDARFVANGTRRAGDRSGFVALRHAARGRVSPGTVVARSCVMKTPDLFNIDDTED